MREECQESENDFISGGYYLKARCIQHAEVATAPPHIREIWDFLLRHANYRNALVSGRTIKRGECLTSYQAIRDGLSWQVGYRTERYAKNHCETAMNYLKKHSMISTEKTTRGLIVTILNYERYQNPTNYEAYNETRSTHAEDIQGAATILKKKKKKDKKETIVPSDGSDVPSGPIPFNGIVDCLNHETGKSFSSCSRETRKLIEARWKEGFRLPDFLNVIRTMTAKWSTDPRMAGYLRPITLFGSKFESYLNMEPR